MAIFKGAGVALITPFKDDMTVDYDMLKTLIDFHCENGTDAIIICGTTGESATLTEREKIQCYKKAVEYTNGRIPVVAGTGSNSTLAAIELSREAQAAGVDGLLIVTPYYNKTTQQGLINHYTMIANEVSLPIILYNVPSRTGLNMAAETAATLINTVENIVGIKEASGNISQVAKIMQLTEGKADLYSGNDDQIVPIMSLGGIGVISVLSNVAPKDTHDMCEAYLTGDLRRSLELQLKAIPLVEQLFSEVNPVPVKKAMQLMGYEVGIPRMPLPELSEANTNNLYDEMKTYGFDMRHEQ